MIDWIKKNIDPPGIEKKNRGSIFSAIGRIFEIVRKDAEKAFKAHFPFLADPSTLRKHGKSLSIPEFPYDSEDEYRERVSAASFFLARSGERAYILDQLCGHFGDEFVLQEEFLRVYMNIAEMSEEDRVWVHSLFDELLDPNIALTISEWLHLIDKMPISEKLSMRVRRTDADAFGGDYFVCNGRFYCDHGRELLCDDTWLCDGSVKCDGYIPVIGDVSDFIIEEIIANGHRTCNGAWVCSGVDEIYSPIEKLTKPLTLSGGLEESLNINFSMEPMEDRMRVEFICDGSFLCNGTNTDSIADGPLTIRIIKPLKCDGTKTPWAMVCDGSIVCDGTYSDFDGPYYSGDVLISEEVIL